jgi:hypothetical protein
MSNAFDPLRIAPAMGEGESFGGVRGGFRIKPVAMDQHERRRALEQQDDLARELIRRCDASGRERTGEPRFDSRLVAAGDGASWMSG